ncbi:MAG: MetS family NSS transporter small subunit [Bacillota bacterium]
MSGNGIFFMVLILTIVWGGFGYFLYVSSKAGD